MAGEEYVYPGSPEDEAMLLDLCEGEFLGNIGQMALENAMRRLAFCNREVLYPNAEGASLGAILRAYQFKKILEEHGLTIVPTAPTSSMQVAWKEGWFRSFYNRYRALLQAAWAVTERTGDQAAPAR